MIMSLILTFSYLLISKIKIEAFADVDYAFEAASILPEFYIPFIWIVILWMTSTIVRSLKDRTAQGNTYWGI